MPYTEGAHDSPADTQDRLSRVVTKYQATSDTVSDGDNVYLAVDFFQDWFKATEEHDAAAVHRLLASSIRDQCMVDQMETFFEISTNAFTYPEMGVAEVLVTAGNSDKAFVSMALRGEPRTRDQGLRDNYVANSPFQIVKEDGRWRLEMNMFVVAEGCPFVYSSSREEAQPSENSTPTSP